MKNFIFDKYNDLTLKMKSQFWLNMFSLKKLSTLIRNVIVKPLCLVLRRIEVNIKRKEKVVEITV